MATQAQVNAFIKLIAPSVQSLVKSRGWGVASAIIAQAGIESAWGTSGLWKSCFNGWGMKWKEGCGCDYKEYLTKEQKSNGSYYTITAKFRKYSSVAAGIEGYFKFIESYSRYIPVRQAKDYETYANQLKICGWATSLNYAGNIIATVKKHGLTQYDTVSAVSFPTVKKGARGEYVRVMQELLRSAGYNIVADGIWGAKTEEAVRAFQADRGLTVDGICGKNTWTELNR